MKEATVLAVIKSQGVFQINPLAYRNDKKVKVLKLMVRKGLICKSKVSPGCANYTIAEKAQND